jgi:cellulose synthase (UDP-forming)
MQNPESGPACPASSPAGQAAGLATLLAIAEAAGQGAPPPARRGRHSRRAASAIPLHQRLTYGAFLAVGLFLAGRFAVFWFNPARLPHDLGRHLGAVDVLLFAGLTFVIWHRQAMDIVGWLVCRRVDPHREPPRPQPGLRVAFITTFVPASESLDMLRRTLASMVMADYPHDTWLLDEGNSAEVRALCRMLGVQHFSRSGIAEYNQQHGRFLAKTKAGNHNAWYAQHADRYDLVAQIDSDFKVRRDFLTRTLGYFADPQVAFVGTPQIYGNMSNLIARGAAQQTYLFYGPLMRALSRRRMALLIGANHIVRVAALQDIGWYQGHLTEDLATGMRFHASRWESVYVAEALAVGEGPTTWTAYFNQQYRWAFGCMNIFFTHSPRLTPKMRARHAVYYFLLEQFYFSGLAMAVALVLLLGYYLLGWAPANFGLQQLITWYVPLLAWRQLMPLWLQRFNVRPDEERGLLWAGRLLTVAAIPIYFLALVGVLRNKRVTWKTTPKGDTGGQPEDELSVFAPHLMLSAVVLAGMTAAVALGHTAWVFLGWGGVTAGLMSGLPAGQLGRRALDAFPRRRSALTQAEQVS